MVVESETEQQSGAPSSLLLSQERLIRKAAGLSHFLINEVAVAPVSPKAIRLYILEKKNLIQEYEFVIIRFATFQCLN